MEVQAARRQPVYGQNKGQKKNVVCTYWLAGKCLKNPCRFLHSEQSKLAPPQKAPPRNMTWKNPKSAIHKSSETAVLRKSPNGRIKQELLTTKQELLSSVRAKPQQCKCWVRGNCPRGVECKFVHDWCCGSGLTMLAKLEGHTKGIAGISLPAGCDKLYSCGKDKTIRAWDCQSGQCAGTLPTEGEIGCLISEDKWVLVGLQNVVKAWNVQNEANFSLDGPVGLVCSMVTDGVDKLFAGIEDGSILAWKWNHLESTSIPEPAAMLKGHTGAVCSLVVGAGNKLYSGSRDCTIKVWDRQSFQCLHTLCGHTRDVTSLLCWDLYLISASLDNTLKVWALIEGGNMEVVYERREDSGVIGMCGIVDGEDKPVLVCSCHDNSVRLYDLPSFTEKGRIFPRGRVEAMEVGNQGLLFTGDSTGEIRVWKFPASATAS